MVEEAGSVDRAATPSHPHAQARESFADTLVGRILGNRYKVTRRLGAGGFGAVFEAEDTKIRKRVAVKVLTRDLVCDTAVVARFRQEAEAASQAGHENIIDITDFDRTSDGYYFLVMELLEGTDLGSVVRSKQKLAIPRVLAIAIQVCRALQAAHNKGILHRDLKPGNIFLTTRGSRADFVKVLDFGISKFMEMDAESGRLTKTGQIVGTPLYMAPEQACGEEAIDHRADIYSLGIILYEAVVGKTPFSATNYLGIIAQHASEPPVPPSKARPDLEVPASVEEIILRAIAKKPADRFSTMEEMEGALIRALAAIDPTLPVGYEATPASLLLARTGAGTPPPTARVDRPRVGMWAGLAVVALAAIGVALYATWPREQQPPPVAADSRVVRLTTHGAVTPASRPASRPVAGEVELEVISIPPGATVLDPDGQRLGVTPWKKRWARSPQPLELTLKRAGHAPATVTLVPDKSRSETVKLKRKARGPLPDEPKGWGEK